MQIKSNWKTKKTYRVELIGLMVAAVIGISALSIGTYMTNKGVAGQQVKMLEDAISRAVVQCYAIEGVYPPNVDYIETHYGVNINEKKYIVHYEIFASNIYPFIKIIEKNQE